tara:strand:+ start:140 stop:433 length:294 start_codon:yes stop_codon:yes gene_type:complete
MTRLEISLFWMSASLFCSNTKKMLQGNSPYRKDADSRSGGALFGVELDFLGAVFYEVCRERGRFQPGSSQSSLPKAQGLLRFIPQPLKSAKCAVSSK